MDRVNGARTIDIGGGRRGFKPQNKSAGTDGTEVTSVWLTDVQENLCRVIEGAGLALAGGDWTLLEKAIARMASLRGLANIPVDGAQSAPPGAPIEGAQYVVAANPSGAWLGRTGQIARWLGGAWVFEAPRAGRVVTRWTGSRLVTERFDGTTWAEWLATDAAAGPVELATLAEFVAAKDMERPITPGVFGQGIGEFVSGAQTVLYVRTDGNNANDGGANTAARAFATIQGALDYIMSRFGAGKSVLIQLGIAGVYSAPALFPTLCNIEIAGGTVAQADSYRVNNAGAPRNIYSISSGYLLLTNIRLENQHAGFHMVDSVVGGQIDVRGITFGASTTAGGLMRAASGGNVRAVGNCIIGCNARAAMLCLTGGSINVTSGTQMVYQGGPAFSAANIEASNLGIVDIAGGGFSGAANGKRFDVSGNAVLNTNAAGVNLLPGTTAGTTTTGGLYV